MMRLLTGGGGGEGGEGGAGKSQSWRRASVVAVGAKVSADAVRRCPNSPPNCSPEHHSKGRMRKMDLKHDHGLPNELS